MEDVLVILYKREKLTEENNTVNDDYNRLETTVDKHEINNYILTPVDVILGQIIDSIFYSKDGEYKVKIIDEKESVNDEFVYSFRYDVKDYTEEEIKELIDNIKNQEIYNTYLIQSYIPDTDQISGVFAYNIYSDRVQAVIQSQDYDKSLATITYDISDYISKLEDDKFLLLTYENLENLEYQKYCSNPHIAKKYYDEDYYSDKLSNEISQYVLCQDEQIKEICSTFVTNQRTNNPSLKNNFILCGNHGVGKSEIMKQLAAVTKLPLVMQTTNDLINYGNIVEKILYDLYYAAGEDLQFAENGIVLIKNCDSKTDNYKDTKRINHPFNDVFLKMVDSYPFLLNTENGNIYFDTSRITFAFLGNFNTECDNIVGYGRKTDNNRNNKSKYIEEIKKCGFSSEFIHNNKIIVMNYLNERDLEKILKESELSYLKIYREFLSQMNIELKYSNKVLEAIAKKAILEQDGARSLKKIVEEILKVANYHITSSNSGCYSELIITPKTVEDNKKFILR